MINHTSKRFIPKMPEYFSQDIDGYRVDVTPTGRFRPILNRLHIEPWYVVGSKLSLVFTYTKINSNAKPIHLMANLIVYYPQNEIHDPPYRITPLPKLSNEPSDKPVKQEYISDSAITKEGTVEIYIADMNFMQSGKIQGRRFELFSTAVIHKDISNHDTFLVVLGILGGGVLGCLGSIVAPLVLAHHGVK